MTSSNERQPKSRRGLWWLGLVALLVFALYSAGWFWLAHRIRSEADGAVLALNARGIQAGCANMLVSGYPLRLNVTCDNVAYEDDARNVAAAAGSLNAVASLPFPWLPTAEIRGPLRTSTPGMAPLWIDWDRLDAAAQLSWPLPRKVSLAAEGLSAQTDPADDSDPVQLLSIGNATAELRPNGPDLHYSGRFSDLEVDASAIGGRVLARPGGGDRQSGTHRRRRPRFRIGAYIGRRRRVDRRRSLRKAAESESGGRSAGRRHPGKSRSDPPGLRGGRLAGQPAGHSAQDSEGQGFAGLHPARRHRACAIGSYAGIRRADDP